MSLWRIAWNYLWNRKVPTCLTILSVALGVALISSVMTLRRETQKRFEEEGRMFDVVVGFKGSPLQLVLSALYFMDNPTGVIHWSDYERTMAHPDVNEAFPIGMGDVVHPESQGQPMFRIVGTLPKIFNYNWQNPVTLEDRYPFQFAEGRPFAAPMEAVIGADVARAKGWKLGDRFIGSHMSVVSSQSHDEEPYTVVGILKPSNSPFDRAILCDMQSVWDLHAHEEEGEDSASGEEAEHAREEDDPKITAVLVDLISPAAQFSFVQEVRDHWNAMATIPTIEITRLYYQLLAQANRILLSVGYLVVVVSGLSIMIGLYLAIQQRRRDLAIMRALGAAKSEITGAILIEALLVTLLGVAVGWLLGAITTWALGVYMVKTYGLAINAWTFSLHQFTAYGTVAFVGMLAGVLPAWQAYDTDVASSLAEL